MSEEILAPQRSVDISQPLGGSLRIEDLAKHAPQWFVAFFAVVYLSGYLTDFFYFSSIGVPDVGTDLAKMKYVQAGIFFYMIFISIGVGWRIFLFKSYPASKRFMFTSGPAKLVPLLFIGSIIFAITFVPVSDYQDDEVPRAALLSLIIFNMVVSISGVWLIDKKNKSIPDRWKQFWKKILAWLLLLGSCICDYFIARPLLPNIPSAIEQFDLGKILTLIETYWFSGLLTTLGWLGFVAFSMSFFHVFYRLMKREELQTSDSEDSSCVFVEEAPARRQYFHYFMGFVLLGLLYLSLLAYAYVIFPHIPVERGGASFCGAPEVHVRWTSSSGGENQSASDRARQPSSPGTISVIGTIIYLTSDTIFIAEHNGRVNNCDWAPGLNFPIIQAIPKSAAIMTINPPAVVNLPRNSSMTKNSL